MSQRVTYFHNPTEDFIVGTIGEPGNRQFFLQFTSTSGTNLIALDKSQVVALIERFEELIREIKRQKLASEKSIFAPALNSQAELNFPITEDFQAGVMGITWEPTTETVSLEIQEISDLEDFADLVQIDSDTSEFEFPPDILQATLSIAQIRGFINLSDRILAGGRSPCPFCGLPIDITGHLCPRANGYKR